MRLGTVVVAVTLALAVSAGAAQLPITDVVLFSNGVGYFQHNGTVAGNASMTLSFRTEQINDILKSLVLQDRGGGTIAPVTYAPQDPLPHILQSFSVPIGDNPSLGELLTRLRGSKVIIRSGTEVRGTVLGIEQRPQALGDEVVECEVVNLLTEQGIVSVPVADIRSLALADEKLNAELEAALAAIASSRDQAKRDIHLSFHGTGQRQVSVGYLLAVPVWKTSYRLVVQDEGKLFLQGWAIVENTTDRDWENVTMALVSGQPVSFRQNLYQPLYSYRPEVPVSVPGAVLPPTYGLAMGRGGYGGGGYGGAAGPAGPAGPPGAPAEEAEAEMKADEAGAGMGMAGRPSAAMLRGAGVVAAAAGSEVGELFQYAIAEPVTIGRQQSAMIPIINQELEGEKVSLFTESVHEKHPMNGLRLVNTTGLHLAGGAITVFDGGVYAGDALLESLPPEEERFIGYAVDLGVEVAVERASTEKQMTLSVDNGVLIATKRLGKTITYTLKSRTDEPRQVIVQTAKLTDWELVEPEEPAEETAGQYRFAVALGPRAAEELVVEMQRPVTTEVALLDPANTDEINFYMKSVVISDELKAALEEIAQRRSAIANTSEQIKALQNRLDEIAEEQDRIRRNMGQLNRDSDLYKKYVEKLTAQEDEFDRVRAERDTLQEKHSQLTTDLNEYIRTLNVA